MEGDESEGQPNVDNNSQYSISNTDVANSDDVIEVNSDSDVTYVDENDPDIANVLALSEIHRNVANQTDMTNPTPTELSQKSTSNSIISISSTSPSKKRRYSEDKVEQEESQTCPICLEEWTTSGDHRICALKCGHLFGYRCIIRWMDAELKKACPTCKKTATKYDIRYIYARKIVAMDTTELTITKLRLDNVIEEKNRLQVELSKATCKIHTLTDEVAGYKKRLYEMMYAHQVQNENRAVNLDSSTETVHLYMEKNVDLGKNSSCRVFDCKSHLDLAAISMKSSNNLYAGFGIKLMNLNNFKPTSFITLHSQAIRDVKFHEIEPWLLSCSIDKKIKILDVSSNRIVTTFNSNNPLWSCSWDIVNDRVVYVGQQQGSVLKFDMRKPSEPISTMSIEGDCSPVVATQAVRPSSSEVPFDAVVTCKLNSAWVFETPLLNETQELMQNALPFDGPFISMTYRKENNHLLLSSRPTSKFLYSRHFLCVLNRRIDGINCDVVHTFRGGTTQKMLSRTCFLSNKNDYVAAYIEDQRVVALWNINTGNKVGSVPARESVSDLKSVKKNCDDFLLSLSESKLEFFKFTN